MEKTFKPLNQLNSFFELSSEKTLSGSDQLVYLHLFNKFNRAHWTETILVDDAELQKLINWYESNGKPASVETVRKAKQRLKKKGFIDFKSGKGVTATEYRLIQLYPNDTPADTPYHTPNDTPYHSSASSNLHVREDVEDSKDEKTDLNKPTNARARGIPKNQAIPAETKAKWAKVSEELDEEVRHAWIQATCENPYGGDLEDLVELQRRYGAKELAETIAYCRKHREFGEVNINYVEKTIGKGGKKRARIIDLDARNSNASFDSWDERANELPPTSAR